MPARGKQPAANGANGAALLTPPPKPFDAERMLVTPEDTYDLLEVVGEGTFSVVHKARRRSDRSSLVAVKRLKQAHQAATRIRDEAGCLHALSGCEHIVQVLDCARTDGQVDIVMPYFEHADFAMALSENLFTNHHVLTYTRGLFAALSHIHARGYVHRDIKPTNVLYSFALEKTLVVDFGLVMCHTPDAKAHHSLPGRAGGRGAGANPAPSTRPTRATAGEASAAGAREDDALLPAQPGSGGAAPPEGEQHGADTAAAQERKRRREDAAKEGAAAAASSSSSAAAPSAEANAVAVQAAPRGESRAAPRHDGGHSLLSGAGACDSACAGPGLGRPPKLPGRGVPPLGRAGGKLATKAAPKLPLPSAIRKQPLKQPLGPRGGAGAAGPAKAGGAAAAPSVGGASATGGAARSGALKSWSARPLNSARAGALALGKAPGKQAGGLPSYAAQREGTRGFRAPEVLLRQKKQGPGIDVWAAGTIVLCLLTRRYPLFQADSDLHALAEILTLLGCAGLTEETLQGLEFGEDEAGRAERLLALVKAPAEPKLLRRGAEHDAEAWAELLRADGVDVAAAPPHVCELLLGCMRFDPAERLTAPQVLALPFFGAEPSAASS